MQIKSLIALTALAVAAQARLQSGFCGENGLDGIDTTVPSCMFEAGDSSEGTNYQYTLAIGNITSCDECSLGSIYGLMNCYLYDCESAYPYEPCGYALCQ